MPSGGKRKGAGRKPIANPKVRISMTIDQDVLNRINEDATRDKTKRSALINSILAAAYGE